MLTLTLWNTAETYQHTIELYQHAPVNLNYQFQDITQVNKARGSYSQTFRIPATEKNKAFFGSVDKPSVEANSSGLINNNYSVKRRIRAELSYTSVPLMRGYVQFKAAYIQKKDFADFEIIFFGDVLDLAKELQEAKLADLDTTTIDHTLNESNVEDSWDETLESGNVIYGAIDKGQNWSFADEGNVPYTSTEGMWQGDFTPYIKAKWLVDKIFSTAGFSYASSLFDSADFAKMFVPAYNGSIAVASDDNDAEQQVALVGLASTFNLAAYALVPLLDSVTGSYDYSSNWDNTTHSWTAPYTCHVTFTLNTRTTGGSTFLGVRVYVDTTIIYTIEEVGAFTATMVVPAGGKITIQAKGSSEYLRAGDVPENPNTWLRIDSVSEPLQGQDVDVSANLPDIKQIDFLMTLQKLFNLVFVPDNNKPKHLIIESFDDYIGTGTKKDWSNKIDYTKDIEVKPTTDLQKNVLDWKYQNGQDFINIAVQQSTGRVYGRYRAEDEDNDFATGESKIEATLSPYIMSYIPNSEITIHRCIDGDGNGVQSPKCKLAYWNGKTTAFGDWYLKNDAGNTIGTQTHFPYFSNYNALNPSVANNDLNFGYERAFFAIAAHPVNTMFYRFWKNYVNELYSAGARLFTAYFKLTRADIQDFEFSDRIFINDTYFRVLKISNYDATQGGVVQVKLLKIISDVADCADAPTGQLANGAITFNGSAFDYGSKGCCEKYGYIWHPDKAGGNSRCYPTTFEQQPT